MNTLEDMEAILAMNLDSDASAGASAMAAAAAVGKSNYQKLVMHRNLRTYSTTSVLEQCPRKYQRLKLDASIASSPRESSVTFAFGHAVGAGVAVYDQTQDIDQAIFAAFLAWDMPLLEEERKIPSKAGKSFAEAIWALYAYENFYKTESPLAEYEVIKSEATVAIDLEDGYYYSGHIDGLLRHRESGRYLVKENKTDGSVSIDPAKYSNSDQALSYSIVVDMLGDSSYTVYYCVYCVPEQRWVAFEFVKTVNAKAEWVQDQLLINQHLDHYIELDFFPKRGAQCMAFNRRCQYYERCDIPAETVYHKTFADLPTIKSIEEISALEYVDYATTMTAIVERQKARNKHG